MDPTTRAALQAAAAADHRADQIDGLRELVAFLEGLPDIELDDNGRTTTTLAWLVRWFGPLQLRALVPSAELGITGPAPVEQPAVVVPSIDEARSRLCSKLAEPEAVAL